MRVRIDFAHISRAYGKGSEENLGHEFFQEVALMLYRAHIDGLRAVAVLPVILYHAEISLFSGGYVGVDVFFVISGYLITSIILEDIKRQRFSVSAFYERRARRILPALFAVLIVCIPLAWLWMLPSDFEEFSKSVAAVSVFSSNILFWQESGYFQTADELRPLIHTWSLGVEEQFYIFFPVMLLLGWRFAKEYLGLLIGIGFVASLAMAHYASSNHPDANFYLLPTRGWELMVGGYLAYVEQVRVVKDTNVSKSVRAALSIFGLSLIFAAVFYFDQSTKHPGMITMMPVLGTAILIRYGSCPGPVNKLLTIPAIVGIGLISYSLYLWHQPLFVFARLYSLDEVAVETFLTLALCSVVLAYLSYKFVERPFRHKKRVSAKSIWVTAGTGSVILLLAGLVGGFTGVIHKSIPADLKTVLEDEHRRGPFLERDGRYCDNASVVEACILGGAEHAPTWAIIGDSHAAAIAPTLDNIWANNEQAGYQLTKPGCAYAPGMARIDLRFDECLAHNAAVRERLLRGDVKSVIVVAAWSQYVEGEGYDNGEGGYAPASDVMGPLRNSPDIDRRSALLNAYSASIEELLDKGIRVFLIYPIPEFGWDVPYRRYKMYVRGLDSAITTDSAAYSDRHEAVVAVFDRLESRQLIKIYPFSVFCDGHVRGRCIAELNTRLLYRDDDHLTDFGSMLLLREFVTEHLVASSKAEEQM